MRRTASEISLGEGKADVERLQLEAEKRRLEQEAKGDGDSVFVNMLVDDLKEMRGALGEMQERIYTQERQQLSDQLGALQAQVAELRDGTRDEGQLASFKRQFEEAKALIEILTPEAAPPPGGGDSALVAWRERARLDERKLDLQHEVAGWDREDRREVALKEVELKEETAREELRMRKEHYNNLDRALTETAPKLIAVAQEWANAIRQSNSPQGSPRGADIPQLPEGVAVSPCISCGNPIYYREEWPGVICSSCGAEYKDMGHGQPPPAEDIVSPGTPLENARLADAETEVEE